MEYRKKGLHPKKVENAELFLNMVTCDVQWRSTDSKSGPAKNM